MIDQDDITRTMIRKVVEDLVVEALQKTFDVYKAVNEGNRQMIAEAVNEYMSKQQQMQQQQMQQLQQLDEQMQQQRVHYEQLEMFKQQQDQQQQRWPDPRGMYGQGLANSLAPPLGSSPLDRFKFWK